MKFVIYGTALALLTILILKHYMPTLDTIDLHPRHNQQLQQLAP
jgi:hypothetical protein